MLCYSVQKGLQGPTSQGGVDLLQEVRQPFARLVSEANPKRTHDRPRPGDSGDMYRKKPHRRPDRKPETHGRGGRGSASLGLGAVAVPGVRLAGQGGRGRGGEEEEVLEHHCDELGGGVFLGGPLTPDLDDDLMNQKNG